MSLYVQVKNSVIFLFSHQDDEVGVLQKIVDAINDGKEVFCLYFTRASSDRKNSLRNTESINVLSSYGVKKDNILFVGHTLGIEDQSLHKHILKANSWLKKWLACHDNVASIYVSAWEGGHPDHDCLNAIAAVLSIKEPYKGKIWQFPLYNSKNCPKYFYRTQYPLHENGEIKKTPINFINRFRFLKSCLGYPSELSAWIGLFPFFLFNYLVIGQQIIQPIQLSRIHSRPHNGVLYYEVRNFAQWADVSGAVYALIKSTSPK